MLLLAAPLLMAQEPAKSRPNFFGLAPPPDLAAVQHGQQLFVTNCGFCHGSTAKGGNNGPDLVRSVLVLRDEGSAVALGPVITAGRAEKGMPKFKMSTREIKDIAAFLLSLSQATVNRGDYKILNVVTGNANAGSVYFQQHCGTCHSSTGDLAGIAAKYDAPDLQARFLYPKTRKSERSQVRATVTLASGESITGPLKAIDDFTVVLVDASGRYRSWQIGGGIKVALTDPLSGHEQLLDRYTDADMHNVLAYLETLK
jgi:mono/diheme cytochrome c family protein